MPHNPFADWRISGTWTDHVGTPAGTGYSAGGEDHPLPFGTFLPAPAAGTLHTEGRPGNGFEFICGWVGSAGRRSILMLDTPIRDVVAVVYQHQSAFGTHKKHYAEGVAVGRSGASANGDEWGGDAHLHTHCLTAAGQRRKFTNYFASSSSTSGGTSHLITVREDDTAMFNLSWAGNRGHLTTDGGSTPIANPTVYNLLFRLRNSNQKRTPFQPQVLPYIGDALQGSPMDFAVAEQTLIDETLRLHQLSITSGVKIDIVKLATALGDALGAQYRPEKEMDAAELAALFDQAIPRIVAAVTAEAARRLAA